MGLVEEYRRGAKGDAVTASMHLAVEDDAVQGRTSVCLPREAYTKRMDKLVNEFVQRDLSYMSAEDKADADKMIEAVERYLFEEQQYRTPTGWREAFSPYRTYFHNVIAQKVGIPATLAAIYIGFLERLNAKGELSPRAETSRCCFACDAGRTQRRADRRESKPATPRPMDRWFARQTWSFACSSWRLSAHFGRGNGTIRETRDSFSPSKPRRTARMIA